jgi:GNAT superfamily N-acetyltransferase
MADAPSSLPGPPAGYALQPLAALTVAEVLQHYEDLTFPPVARRLAVRPAAGAWRGAVALDERGPVGLALVETGAPGDPGTAQLFSLAVLPGHRRRRLGGALVAAAERLARDAGAHAIEGAFRTSWRSRRAIEALLAGRGWPAPETRMVLARGETGFARAYLRAPAPELPPKAEIFAWEELTAAERDLILERQRDDPWFPAILTPFQEEPRLEPTVSVGLRWRGEVAGWLICHRVAFDTLQYSAYFVREDLRGRGLGAALMREGVRRRLADPDIRHAILAIDARNRRVRALIEGPFRRYFAGISELRVSRRRLDE